MDVNDTTMNKQNNYAKILHFILVMFTSKQWKHVHHCKKLIKCVVIK